MKTSAFRFVIVVGVVSLFADMTYEGGRSITGPFLAQLGATGLIVGIVAGFGELAGYGLRVVSGRLADRTGRYWAFTFFGYALNVLAVPALALARAWPAAAALLIGERIGRGIRKPSVGSMLAHAGARLGHGWAFGFHEAMDQTGATLGPLIVAGMLALGSGFSRAFAVLVIPALLTLVALSFARLQYPAPHDLEAHAALRVRRFSRAYWLYAAAGSCVAAGFSDFALLAFHLSKAHVMANDAIPVLYAGAMLVGAISAPLLGRLYDRSPLPTLVVSFAIATLFAPFGFLGAGAFAVGGVLLWGFGMGAQETLLPAAVASIAPAAQRATALGAFDGLYGVAWFVGSAAMGALYDVSVPALVALSMLLEALSLPLFIAAVVSSTKEQPGSPA